MPCTAPVNDNSKQLIQFGNVSIQKRDMNFLFAAFCPQEAMKSEDTCEFFQSYPINRADWHVCMKKE